MPSWHRQGQLYRCTLTTLPLYPYNFTVVPLQFYRCTFTILPLYLYNFTVVPLQFYRCTLTTLPLYPYNFTVVPLQLYRCTFTTLPLYLYNFTVVPLQLYRCTFTIWPLYLYLSAHFVADRHWVTSKYQTGCIMRGYYWANMKWPLTHLSALRTSLIAFVILLLRGTLKQKDCNISATVLRRTIPKTDVSEHSYVLLPLKFDGPCPAQN